MFAHNRICKLTKRGKAFAAETQGRLQKRTKTEPAPAAPVLAAVAVAQSCLHWLN